MSLNLLDASSLGLDQLRDVLIRLEDTIIFNLVERAQFSTNDRVYHPGEMDFQDGFTGSFLDWFLLQVETVHAKVRRYESPDEYPFTKDLPAPILPSLEYPSHIKRDNELNLNDKIKSVYIDFLIPKMCKNGDDKNYGSTATRDIECLQALSRRIHYGKFVAEAKFRDPKYHDTYVRMINEKDRDGLMKLLTNEQVEIKLLERLRKKASIYGQDIDNTTVSAQNNSDQQRAGVKIDSDLVVKLYKEYVIPLTKEVEVLYLLNRI